MSIFVAEVVYILMLSLVENWYHIQIPGILVAIGSICVMIFTFVAIVARDDRKASLFLACIIVEVLSSVVAVSFEMYALAVMIIPIFTASLFGWFHKELKFIFHRSEA